MEAQHVLPCIARLVSRVIDLFVVEDVVFKKKRKRLSVVSSAKKEPRKYNVIGEIIKTQFIQLLGLCAFPIFEYLLKHFAQIYRVWSRQVGVPPRTPTLWPENSANIWNLLWLSWPLII